MNQQNINRQVQGVISNPPTSETLTTLKPNLVRETSRLKYTKHWIFWPFFTVAIFRQ